jgi:TonB family protein
MKKLLPLTLSLLLALGCCAQTAADGNHAQLDTVPLFEGCPLLGQSWEAAKTCSDQRLIEFISTQLKYPEAARQNGTEGIVYVSFVVTADGKIREPRLFNDIGDGCGEAALAVVRSMPDWSPGRKNGDPVNARLNLPIQFRLQDKENDRASQLLLTWGMLSKSEASTRELKACLDSPLLVRDPDGTPLPLVELAFFYESAKGKRMTALSRGSISSKQAALVKKARKGGKLFITATVQEHGRFLNISRSFNIY